MTREEIMGMNAEELRLAIARRKHGAKVFYRPGAPAIYWVGAKANWSDWREVEKIPAGASTWYDYPCSNWPTSLADAWELEAQLTPKQQEKYAFLLFRITSGYEGESETIIRWGRGLYDDQYFGLIHASPEQRCRAWLLAQEALAGDEKSEVWP